MEKQIIQTNSAVSGAWVRQYSTTQYASTPAKQILEVIKI
jgi:hypothetical protein